MSVCQCFLEELPQPSVTFTHAVANTLRGTQKDSNALTRFLDEIIVEAVAENATLCASICCLEKSCQDSCEDISFDCPSVEI